VTNAGGRGVPGSTVLTIGRGVFTRHGVSRMSVHHAEFRHFFTALQLINTATYIVRYVCLPNSYSGSMKYNIFAT